MPRAELKVLIVDDDPAQVRMLERGLRSHRVTVDTDPRRARERLRTREWFDVVLCDVHMPGLSGFELLREAREQGDGPIFVLMSGSEDLRQAPADAILHKPFDLSHLLELVAVLARKRASEPTQRIERGPAAGAV